MKTFFSVLTIACALVISGCDENVYDEQTDVINEQGQTEADGLGEQADQDDDIIGGTVESNSTTEIEGDLQDNRGEAEADRIEADANRLEAQGERIENQNQNQVLD